MWQQRCLSISFWCQGPWGVRSQVHIVENCEKEKIQGNLCFYRRVGNSWLVPTDFALLSKLCFRFSVLVHTRICICILFSTLSFFMPRGTLSGAPRVLHCLLLSSFVFGSHRGFRFDVSALFASSFKLHLLFQSVGFLHFSLLLLQWFCWSRIQLQRILRYFSRLPSPRIHRLCLFTVSQLPAPIQSFIQQILLKKEENVHRL